jgi:regulator of RNase E activity RraB
MKNECVICLFVCLLEAELVEESVSSVVSLKGYKSDVVYVGYVTVLNYEGWQGDD